MEKKTDPGIIYLSRIPPFMNPLKVRKIFSQYGEIGRLFLQPEESSVRKQRKRSGGNGRKCFTEGWVEFKDKDTAEAVALTLNNTSIGGKKRSYYHDDIWNIKYLEDFQWGFISEKIAYEKAAREQRMRLEISQAKKEATFYMENVAKGKAITAMEKRRKRKLKDHKSDSSGKPITLKNVQANKTLKQKKIDTCTESSESRKLKTSLLSKIFTNS